jgi:hypothetical protein
MRFYRCLVMAGLVPAIHVFFPLKQDVDARHKAGHDECICGSQVIAQ